MTSTLEAPTAADATTASPHGIRGRLAALNRHHIGLGILLLATAVFYLWNITINGMGNQFYAGAAWAGSRNWEALLFGSVDPNNFITVDKPPVSQWAMALSGQIFGFSSASMLVPEALMAVASVALLYGAVRRIAGPNAALLAGALFALTPVVALMFRYNNPDAVMVLLMMAGAYCTVRALENAGAKWLALAGVAVGFAFLAKMLEGLMVAPAIGLAYLIVAPTSIRRRLAHLGVGVLACVVSAGWFVVLTLLWPAASRPYLAGSTDNNFMNLVLGYNGLARILGREHNGGMSTFGPSIGSGLGTTVRMPSGHHGGFGPFGGADPGITRLFSGEFGFEIGWLLPAALIALIVVLVSRRRAPRTDLVRGGAILFGGWLLIDGLVLSYMKGMAHPYYCLSVAPAVVAMVAIGGSEMWRLRQTVFGRATLTATILATGVWSWWLLGRNAEWMPPLRWVILAMTLVATAAVLVTLTSPKRRRWAAAAVGAGVVVAALGSAAYSFATIGESHEGGGATVGPPAADRNGPGHGGWGDTSDNPQLDAMLAATHTKWSAAINGSSAAAGLELSTHTPVMAVGGFSGSDPVPTLSDFQADVANHQIGYYVAPDPTHGFGRGRQHIDITRWVETTFRGVKVGSATVYDLSTPLPKS